MLKRSQSLFSYHIQAMIQSINTLCRNPFGNLMTIIVIAIALALPAFFWVMTDNLNRLTQGWQRGGHLTLYLQQNLKAPEQQLVLESIIKTQGVGQAVLKTSEEGLKELTHQEGMQDIMNYLPENPLPAVIDVTPSLTVDSEAKLDLLARQIQKDTRIAQVKLDIAWINRLNAVLGFAGKMASSLMALLALAVILIIGNTLRLSIHSRQEEIQVLKLIGAADPFILRPFLYSGIWYGLAGAIVAVFFVNIIILSLGMAMNHLAVVYQMHYPLSSLSIRQILLLVIFASILGWIGARFSVKRQLASIEPYN